MESRIFIFILSFVSQFDLVNVIFSRAGSLQLGDCMKKRVNTYKTTFNDPPQALNKLDKLKLQISSVLSLHRVILNRQERTKSGGICVLLWQCISWLTSNITASEFGSWWKRMIKNTLLRNDRGSSNTIWCKNNARDTRSLNVSVRWMFKKAFQKKNHTGYSFITLVQTLSCKLGIYEEVYYIYSYDSTENWWEISRAVPAINEDMIISENFERQGKWRDNSRFLVCNGGQTYVVFPQNEKIAWPTKSHSSADCFT